MNWKYYYDIVILPPSDVMDHAIALSRSLEPYGPKFLLGRRRYVPHISLYHVPVRPRHFSKFAKEVKAVASEHSGGELQIQSVEMPVLMTTKPDWIQRLHLDLVERTKPFFDREYGVEKAWNLEYLPDELKRQAHANLKKHGSPMIDEVFRPHITLTSFKDKDVAKKVPALKFEKLSFEVNEISIRELGPSHTCHGNLATYNLAID